MEVRTILTPTEIAALHESDLSGTVCVVFDVLRATSTIVAALVNGARRIFPASTVDQALALRREQVPDALLGGERGGVRIGGFDVGNSPREYVADVVAGRDVITTTTNGTVALAACRHAHALLAAGLVNLEATAAWLLARPSVPEKLWLVCAGTGSEFALEDGMAAGALAARLGTAALDHADDATRAMRLLYECHRTDLEDALTQTQNGQRLREIGLGDDVAWCARESVLDEVALWDGEALQSARNRLRLSSPAVN